MATNQRDENIRLVFEATGSDQLAQAAGHLTDIADAGGAAGVQAQALLDKLLSLGNTNALIQTLITQKGLLQDNGDALALAKIKLADLQAQMDATATPSAALERSFAKTSATVTSLDAQYNQHQATITRVSSALAAAGVDTNNLDSEQRRISQSLAETNESASKLGVGMGTVAVETENAGEKAANAGGFFSTLRDHLAAIVSIAAAVEIALKGIEFGKESIEGAEEVEASLSRVKALAQGTQEQFAGLDQAIEDAADSVNTTTQNAAVGLAALASQGLPAKSAVDALIPTLQLAKIANVDAGTAAGILAGALKAFQLPASSAADVVDKLTSASHGAAGGLSAIGNTVTTLAPDAKALGISFDTLVSIVGLLSSRGVDSEKSMRGLRTVFQDLENPTSKLRVELLGLGDGSNNFGTAVTALTAPTQRARDALNTLDGPARSLVLTLGQAGPDALAKFQAGLNQTQGAASKTASAIDDNLRGAATRFENAIEGIGEKLAKPILTPLAAELTKLAGQLNDFSKSPDFQKIVDAVGKITTDGIAKLAKAIHDFDWVKFKNDAIDALDTIKDDAGKVADAVGTIGTAINKTADLVGVGYHAIGVAIDGATVAGSKFLGVVGDLAQKGDALSEGTEKAAKNFDELNRTLEDVSDIAGGNLKSHLTGLGDDVTDLAGNTDKATKSTKDLSTASTDTSSKLQTHGEKAKGAAEATGQLSATLLPVPEQLDGISKAASASTVSLEELGQKGSNATVDLKTAYTLLGVTAQQSLGDAAKGAKVAFDAIDAAAAKTAEGLADRQNAFLSYAAKALAASAQLSDGQKDSTQAALQTQAAILGVSDALQTLVATSDKSTAGLISDVDRYSASLAALGDQMHKQEQDFQNAGNAAQYAGDQSTKALDATQAAAKATQDTIDEYSNEGGSSLAQLDQALADTRNQFLSVSAAAAKAFDSNLIGDFGQTFDSTGIGFARVIQSMSEASATVTKTIADQREQLQAEVADINNVGVASTTSFGQFGNNADAATARMKALSADIQNGTYDAGLLAQQELAPLQAALDAAAQRTQALADAAKSANDQLEDLNDQLLDSIDEATGNKTDQENRRYQQQLQQIQDLYKQAGELGSQAYNLAVQRANQLHQLNMQQIAQQAQAQNNANGTSSTSGGTGIGGGSGGQGGSSLGSLAPVHIHINGQEQDGAIYANQSGIDLLQAIARAKANSI